VLLSELQGGAVTVDLHSGETLEAHQLGERVVMEVVSGRVRVECSGESHEFEAGALVTFDRGESHSERALSAARLIFDLREDGFAQRSTPIASPAKRSWASTAPDWVLCLGALAGLLVVVALLLLSGTM
jgi:hypothetical protein